MLLSAAALIWLALAVAPSPSDVKCGVERWDVKTGVDLIAYLADGINKTPKAATIPALRALRPPDHIKTFKGRAPGVEDQYFTVVAAIAMFKREADGDYHVVLVDESGESLIVELPDPRCVDSSSPLHDGVVLARMAFDDLRLRPGDYAKGARVTVRVTGPGFFDFIHGQTGHAPNGIEIHPVVDIQEVKP